MANSRPGQKIKMTSIDELLCVPDSSGTTEIAIISAGGVVECESIKVAGTSFDEAIVKYIRRKHNMLIGSQMISPLITAFSPTTTRPLEIILPSKEPSILMSLGEVISPLITVPVEIRLTSLTFTVGSIVFAIFYIVLHIIFSSGPKTKRRRNYTSPLPWQFLYFFPLPHGQGSLRPIFLSATTGVLLFCSPLVERLLRFV